jgi:hypothetical protein
VCGWTLRASAVNWTVGWRRSVCAARDAPLGERMNMAALEACGACVTGILSLAEGHQERVRPLPFLCSLHLIEAVDASVILFHDNTESTRDDHCGVT